MRRVDEAQAERDEHIAYMSEYSDSPAKGSVHSEKEPNEDTLGPKEQPANEEEKVAEKKEETPKKSPLPLPPAQPFSTTEGSMTPTLNMIMPGA